MTKVVSLTALLLAALLTAAMASASVPSKRVALIIGNSSYEDQELPSARIDAQRLAAEFAAFGFQLIGGSAQLDVGTARFEQLIAEFSRAAGATDVGAVFYFSGHGVQVNGEQFLLPVDQPAESAAGTRPGIPLRLISHASTPADSGHRLIIVDACRTERLKQRPQLAVSTALAGLPPRTIVSLAQVEGAAAGDGTPGAGSDFSLAWSEALRRLRIMAETPGPHIPGLPFALLLEEVSRMTFERTQNRGALQVTDAGIGPMDPFTYLTPRAPSFFWIDRAGYVAECAELAAHRVQVPRSVCPDGERTSEQELLRIAHERLARWWSESCRRSPALTQYCHPDPANVDAIHALVAALDRSGNGSFHQSWDFDSTVYPLALAARRGSLSAQRELAAWLSSDPEGGSGRSKASMVSVALLYMAAMAGDAGSASFLAEWLLAGQQPAPETMIFQQSWQLSDLLRRHGEAGNAKAARLLSRIWRARSTGNTGRAAEYAKYWEQRAGELGG